MFKKIFTLSSLMFLFTFNALQGQTSLEVYQILQTKCGVSSCHSNADQEAGLDLEGEGATIPQRAADVYSNVFEVTPNNALAVSKGYDYIYPGRPDKSFLFRKLNQGLEQTFDLHADAGDAMPPANSPQLTDVEKEMVRQWILYGAPITGTVVETDLIEEYYSGNGLASFDTPPPAPDPSEGYQIKMGPFYLKPQGQPGDEVEYYQKYELEMDADKDVDRIDMKIASSSHHLIIYDYDSPFFANSIPPGLRLFPDHSGVGLVAAIQEATDLKLPATTAFKWEDDLVLDLNSHYINYSSSMVYQAEAYINVYTKPAGTAEHEMKTELIVNGNIPIPNNGNPVSHTQTVWQNNLGEIYVWGLMGHTHKYGTGYKVYRRENNQQGELIYDAACPGGTPGCASPFFDYQHIPIEYFEPLMPLAMTLTNGFVHEASWINDGPFPVNFGPTSADEMMVLVLMYTDEQLTTVSVDEPGEDVFAGLKVSPNPMTEGAIVELPADLGELTFKMYDMLGQEVRSQSGIRQNQFEIRKGNLQPGMYLFSVEDLNGQRKTGKLVIE